MALNKRYTRQEFIRSLIVVLVSLAVTIGIVFSITESIKASILNNVKVSGEYLTGKMVDQLNVRFASTSSPAFVLARKALSKDELENLIDEANKKKISKESIDSIAIWAKDETTGKIINKYHTNSGLSNADLYGMKEGDQLTADTVKDYFKLKIENVWLEKNFDTVQGFVIEDMGGIMKSKIRNYAHAVKKFNLNGKEFLLDIQYEKRSISEVRILKEVQKAIVVAIFAYMLFLTIYALFIDKNLLMHMLILWVVLFTIYPIVWVIGLSFKTENSLGGTNLNPVPPDATVDNYKAALFNLKVVKDEGLVISDSGRIYLSVSKKDEKDVDPIHSSNIKKVYNVFDENITNLWAKGEVTLKKEKHEEQFTYNDQLVTTVEYKYYLDFKNKPSGDSSSQIYNVEYYKYQNTLFMSGLLNSIFVALATAILGMMLSSAAAYAFSRFRFPGRGGFMMSFLVTQMFPGTMMLIPLYVIFSNLGLINTFRGLILAYSITALPFNIWNLKGFFDTIPKELEEAALIDGCSASQTFYIIVLPLSLPALAISSLFAFMGAWNEYIMAATFMNEESKYTIPVVIRMLVGSNSVDWPLFAAMSVLVSIPVVIVFMMSQKYLVGGLTAGGVKG